MDTIITDIITTTIAVIAIDKKKIQMATPSVSPFVFSPLLPLIRKIEIQTS